MVVLAGQKAEHFTKCHAVVVAMPLSELMACEGKEAFQSSLLSYAVVSAMILLATGVQLWPAVLLLYTTELQALACT
jgi:hypothetical protein